jgi:hypothetical protein
MHLVRGAAWMDDDGPWIVVESLESAVELPLDE